MAEALRLGLSRRSLYDLRDQGLIHPLSRGVCRLAALPPLGNPDLVTVAARLPQGVVCLVSALAFHELTTQSRTRWTSPSSVAQPQLGRASSTRPWPCTDSRARRSTKGSRCTSSTPSRCASTAPRKPSPTASSTATSSGWRSSWKLFAPGDADEARTREALLKYARVCRVEAVMRPYLEALT